MRVEDIRSRVEKAQRNYVNNKTSIEKILLYERGYVSKPPINEDVVVIASGGLDSSVMINMLIEEYNVKVHLLYIRRGARAQSQEEKAFDFFVDFYKKRFPDNIGNVAKIDYEIPPTDFKRYFPAELAQTVGHPLRNSTMQNLAVMYAVSLNGQYGLDIRTIFTGSVAEDNTEPELGLLSLRTQTLNTCVNLGDWNWTITSPLTDNYLREKPISKVGLIRYAIENSIPLKKTRTCFSKDDIADGTCFACIKRLQAFADAGFVDPIEYEAGK